MGEGNRPHKKVKSKANTNLCLKPVTKVESNKIRPLPVIVLIMAKPGVKHSIGIPPARDYTHAIPHVGALHGRGCWIFKSR